MLPKRSSLIILLLLSSTVLSAYINSDSPATRLPLAYQQYGAGQPASSRLLQAVSTVDKLASAGLSKAVSEANAARSSKGIPLLGANASIGTIVSQWFRALKGSISLTMYLQLYGIVNVQIEIYPSIPSEYITGVLKTLSLGLSDSSFNQVSTFSGALDANNYEVILIFQGGDSAQLVQFSNKNIQDAISIINSKNVVQTAPQEKQSQTVSTQANQNVQANQTESTKTNQIVSTQVNETVSLQANQTVSTQTNLTASVSSVPAQTANSSTPSQTASTPQNTSNQAAAQNNQAIAQNSSNQETVEASTKSNKSIQSPPASPVITQSNKTQIRTNLLQTKNDSNNTPTPPFNNITVDNSTDNRTPQLIQPQQKPIQTYQTPSTGNTQISSVQTPLPVVQDPVPVAQAQANTYIPKPASQTAPNTPQRSTPTYAIITPPSLPLITQTIFTNTTSFAGILLTHALPTTFLKNEIFPFKGVLTAPNPSGTMVSVIFTRISDQQRLPFSQYLTANITSFKILVTFNLTGVYYLSVFAGGSGFASLTQYTVAPSFIGQIVSRPPRPLANATLRLVNNDLWLNWAFSDVVQPPLTQIIFTQADYSVHFLLTNYQSSLKVPYGHFWAFNSGITNIQISQAFSSNQSANKRTSDFSAPYNIIFNATEHNYAIVKDSSQFAPIQLSVATGKAVTIVGPAGVQVQNAVLLQTPSKTFIDYYIDGNSSNKYIEKGYLVNLTISLNETGVYILEVNDAGGEALINIPIYYGDIYPLVPDFVDLTSPYIDLAALSQPSLIQDRRTLVLNLLNAVRNSFGVSNLYLDKNLNALAQNYSAVMIQNNYIGHIDKQGRTPSQRAAAFGILEGVGENLAMNNNLTQAQLMLQRSPAHLRNMVNPDWTRVGLGIVQNSNKFYFLTQQFSSRDLTLYPLNTVQINQIEGNLVNHIISKYSYIQGEDKMLSSRLKDYQNMANRPYIITYLLSFGYKNVAVANIEVSYNNGNFMSLIKSGNNFEPTSTVFKQVGVTVMYKKGNLEIFAAYV